MKMKKSISLQDSVDFCNSVIETATVDDQYIPGLLDYAIRVNSILFFSDFEFKRNKDGLINQDEACSVAFETTYYEDILGQSKQLYGLISACKEQVRINHDILLAALRPADQMQRLVDILENMLGGASDFAKNIDPSMIALIAERIGDVKDGSIVDAVMNKQGLQKRTSKRSKNTTNKDKKRNNAIVQVPGQIGIEELTSEVISTMAKE